MENPTKTPARTRALLLAGLLAMAGCAGGDVRESAGGPAREAPAAAPAGGEWLVNLRELCREPARFAGRTVVLDGVFQGFRVAGCRFPDGARPTGVTRSDWLFRTGEDCLYVTGGMPAGFDRLDPEYLGRPLELTARVARDAAGELYLELVDARPVSEPADGRAPSP